MRRLAIAMARLARQKPVVVEVQVQAEAEAEVEVSDDELPELATLLRGTGRNIAEGHNRPTRVRPATTSPRRSSPRRRGTVTAGRNDDVEVSASRVRGLDLNNGISAISLTASMVALPPPTSPVKRSPMKCSPTKAKKTMQQSDGPETLLKWCGLPATERERRSEAATSMQQRQRSLKLAHVNSLLLPLSQVVLGGTEGWEQDSDVEYVSPSWEDRELKGALRAGAGGRTTRTLFAIEEPASFPRFDAREEQTERERDAQKASLKRAAKEKGNDLSRFVLKEAGCNDDFSNSGDDEDDELTDLSGFVVDDDAELSFHGSDSNLDGGFESGAEKPIRKGPPRKRRLQRGRNAARENTEDEVHDGETDSTGKESIVDGDIVQDLSKLRHSVPNVAAQQATETEVIDLTSSPPKARPDLQPKPGSVTDEKIRPCSAERSSSGVKPFDSDENNHLLQFSPPRFKSPAKVARKAPGDHPAITKTPRLPFEPSAPDTAQVVLDYTTPPTTPSASPTKLKSPSKIHLLSPSKRGTATSTSPHRQSIDAFWSSDVINTWNDQYSPRKPPLTVSPKKRGVARLLDFDICSDSDQDANVSRDDKGSASSSSDPPTPTRSSSPNKNPKSPSKLSSPSKKALAQAKRTFEASRHATAQTLLAHLDANVTSGKLSSLSASTGGVQILWSKNLRSTAGRANWRRTVTKPLQGLESLVKARPEPKTLTQHYASIELAEKVIDSDSRLVNTLAHEFCHLANFMVSGVRDQPHGASFKAWADKVSSHLRTAPNLPELYRSVEVTTKHSYTINHKYLWVCAGQSALQGSAQAAARAFLALDDDPGCGAEYGRHSKSVDPEKHRCGKCKGLLVQVRPMPKVRSGKAELKGRSPRKGKGASPAKQPVGIDGRPEDSGERVAGRDDNLDGLQKALEYVNLSA